MEEIRLLTPSDMPEWEALVNFAFQRENITEEPLVDAKPEWILGYFAEGELASTVTVIPLEVFIHGTVHDMGLIAGVASWPEHRRNGMIGKLLVRALFDMRSNGHTISYLVPFSYPFYRKYGWEMTHEYMKYAIPSEHITGWSGEGTVKRMKRPDIETLGPLYEQYALTFNGMLKRSDERWNRSILKRKKGQIVVYRNRMGEPRGYMIYEAVRNEFTVHESVYLDEDARHGLLEHVGKHEGMFRAVALSAPADDQLPFLMANPKRVEAKRAPHIMARVVDVVSFLETCSFRPDSLEKPLAITVSDRFAAWNNGTFLIERDSSGRAAIYEADPAPGDAAAVACDIQTFTALLMGYQSASFLQQAGRLSGTDDEVRRWQAAIPRRTNYYIDFGS